MNIHIPTITIKNKPQPPWFDSDTHHLCLKKERLRAKFNETGRAEDYNRGVCTYLHLVHLLQGASTISTCAIDVEP